VTKRKRQLPSHLLVSSQGGLKGLHFPHMPNYLLSAATASLFADVDSDTDDMMPMSSRPTSSDTVLTSTAKEMSFSGKKTNTRTKVNDCFLLL
jgi:hypothetical protein